MNYFPNTREKLGIILNDCEMFGVAGTLRHMLAYWLSRPRDDFDDEHGVSTVGTVHPSDIEIRDTVAFDNALNYEPTSAPVMQHILRYVAAHLKPTSRTFVDLGCGRGRALLMAAELPFIEVVGVEISPSHCKLAEQNIAAYRAARGRRSSGSSNPSVRVQCSDVTQFEFPPTDLIVYMFNPFRGPVFRAVMERIVSFQRSTGREVHLILSSPQSEPVLTAHPAFVKRHEFQVISWRDSWNLWQCRAAALHAVQPVAAPTTGPARKASV